MQCTCKYTYGDRLYLCNICIICIQYIIIQYIQVIVRSNIPGLSLRETDCGMGLSYRDVQLANKLVTFLIYHELQIRVLEFSLQHPLIFRTYTFTSLITNDENRVTPLNATKSFHR